MSFFVCTCGEQAFFCKLVGKQSTPMIVQGWDFHRLLSYAKCTQKRHCASPRQQWFCVDRLQKITPMIGALRFTNSIYLKTSRFPARVFFKQEAKMAVLGIFGSTKLKIVQYFRAPSAIATRPNVILTGMREERVLACSRLVKFCIHNEYKLQQR